MQMMVETRYQFNQIVLFRRSVRERKRINTGIGEEELLKKSKIKTPERAISEGLLLCPDLVSGLKRIDRQSVTN